MTASTTRTPARLRYGAEQGVSQVLTPDEALAILDRLADAEAVEAAAEAVRSAPAVEFDDAVSELVDALARRTTRPAAEGSA